MFSIACVVNQNMWKIEMIVFYVVIKKNPEISFWNGPEHETKSLSK